MTFGLNMNTNREHFYVIDEITLEDLLICKHILYALEDGGVDSWPGYGESLEEYLKNEEAETINELVEKEIEGWETL